MTNDLRNEIATLICGARAADNWMPTDTDTDLETADAILAKLDPDTLANPVLVKPLVWEESYGVWRAKTSFGDYKVAGKMLTLPLPMNPQQIHTDDEAAKDAAQADYETRIRSALEPAEAPDPDALIVAALEAASVKIQDVIDIGEKYSEQQYARGAKASRQTIRALAADPEARAAIKRKAGWSE